ncbi:MAG: acetyl/propionyl/methylcrotonyl-CoA carboxylase subunit alpha [Nisaea sp.]|uniref:acetyl-CoA carboxylase biotin carboxylase subunit n=1 Tax=Nisaea sp. TaxID=2024842 RepID=UPI001B18D64F|nr:acetyl/propionyl/methylcrotonyl-CoA carboxylase subunit alpha [Nisaea sp.]MBO6559946.1 acetyl/propionyl/methylcrotonyl-CoA carboxylase subunit alpha [Nisaea sp.]
MFKKILIANRGEIACRVMRTAKRMGIQTVAVYSDADADALHVKMADEAVHIGPAPSAESYLVIDRIMDAIRQTGAEAVHPGYGFLSENATFAKALEKEGVAFIGPGVKAIGAMGDKIESKKLAHEAKVNTVPGYLGILADEKEAAKVAAEIGFPVMIKASAGGGGKGMRIAHSAEEVASGFRSAVNEARSSFGDERVFIEKFIEEPRHIEIQVIADKHGNVVHLGERECSIQRRHQKVIEEAPSPFLDEKTRAEMGAQAVALAKAVDYSSAGTVEFIVDGKRNFYFLEMNTRLQVEHPVTELVTGLDLVEIMIRSAAGEKLPFTQKDIKLTGWAMESRIYAEDPYRGFLPSTGRLVRYRPPAESDSVRCDTGVYEGAEISMFYDPMVAKLCTYGKDRIEAIDRMAEALDRFHIRGVGHNVDFLAAMMAHERFRDGRLTTNFIAEEYPDGFEGAPVSEEIENAMRAVAVAAECANAERNRMISGQTPVGDRKPIPSAWKVRHDDAAEDAEAAFVDGGYDVTIGGTKYEVRGALRAGEPVFGGTVNGKPFPVQMERRGIDYHTSIAGAQRQFTVLSRKASDLLDRMPKKEAADLSKFLLSPMPGLLVSLAVSEGDPVKAGQELAVVEAMKMENVLRATKDGTVAKIHAAAGASLAVDQQIMEFE